MPAEQLTGWQVIGLVIIGLAAIAVMLVFELATAGRQQRRPELGAIVLIGVLGIGWFLAMTYASGSLR